MSEAINDAPPDLDSVAWTWTLGRAGPYERAKDDGSLAFQRLLSRLERAGGSFDSDGYHVWIFGRTICRRAKRSE
jgi:hypothetical protein